MMQLAIPLFVINLALLLLIGLIRQQNPFEIWVLALLVVGNLAMILFAAFLTHGNWVKALSALATNFFPVLFVAGGLALLMFVMSYGTRDRRSRS